jgi:hypothetical protein
MLTFMFLLIPAGSWIERHYGLTGPGLPIAMIVLFIAGLLWVAWTGFSIAKKLGLRCSNCGFWLVEKSGRHALATGNCQRCKKPVFSVESDPRELPRREPKLSRAKFTLDREALQRDEKRRLIRVLVFGACVLIACVPVVKHFDALAEEGRLEGATLFWLAVGTTVLVGASWLALLGAISFIMLGKVKGRGEPCPHCSRPLAGTSGRIAIATGRCMYCDAEIFADSASSSVAS